MALEKRDSVKTTSSICLVHGHESSSGEHDEQLHVHEEAQFVYNINVNHHV